MVGWQQVNEVSLLGNYAGALFLGSSYVYAETVRCLARLTPSRKLIVVEANRSLRGPGSGRYLPSRESLPVRVFWLPLLQTLVCGLCEMVYR